MHRRVRLRGLLFGSQGQRHACPFLHCLCRFNVLGSKFLPRTGNPLVDFISKDWYYSLLLPMSVPVTLVGLYLNWLALKFFKHN